MDQIRIADLPTIDNIQQNYYVIIENPNIGEGTYKCKVETLGYATIPQELIDRVTALEQSVQSMQDALQSIEGRLQDVETAVGSLDIRLQSVEQVANVALTIED